MTETPLRPEDRQLPGARGTPLVIDGQTWLLADYVPEFGPLWDRLYDQALGCLEIDPFDALTAAVRLLMLNYELSVDEAVGLVRGSDPVEFIAIFRAAVTAIFGPQDRYRGWSDWAQLGLFANGIKASDVPGPMLSPLLQALVMQGRWIPQNQYIEAAQAAKVRAAWGML